MYYFFNKENTNYRLGDYMNYIEKLKKETNEADDFVYKNIVIGSNKVDLINIESITSSDDINNFILKKISFLDKLNTKDLTDYLYNYLPITSISYVSDYKTLKDKLLNGFTILIINDKDILAVETRRDLTRGVSEADYEKTIVGPKDAFIEHYNTNLGLIRRRIKDENLHIKTYSLGKCKNFEKYQNKQINVMYY